MLERFYCPERPLDGRATLEGDEARHLIKVRRVGVGEQVELFDGRGTSFRAQVSTIERDRAVLAILGPGDPDRSPAISLTLATAVPKGERFDWLIEKATELGVARLVPLVTERSVVDPRSAKLDRLRRAIVEASKQCRRNRLMDLGPPTAWDSLIEDARGSTRLLAHPGAPGIASVGGLFPSDFGPANGDWPRSAAEVPVPLGPPTLPRKRGQARAEYNPSQSPFPKPTEKETALVSVGLRPDLGSVILAIGPEGGFSDREVDRAVKAGWRTVGLGSTILRVETAAIAACSTILALMETVGESTRISEAT